MDSRLPKYTTVAACVISAVAVVLMAVAAHALPESAPPSAKAAVETAGVILLIHGVGAIALRNRGRMWLAKVVLLAGAIVFSGAIYLRYLLVWEAIGLAAPIGGAALIVGWLLAALFATTTDRHHH